MVADATLGERRPASGGHAPIEIRGATAGDVAGLASLLAELGYPAPEASIAERLELVLASGEIVLVAVRRDALVGLLTGHVTPVLHRPAPVGRITALVITERARGQGVGRALVTAAEAALAARGCGMVEVTSNRRRTDAHAFYEHVGYQVTSLRFNKLLAPDA